jgi:hypothetical protein
MSSDNGAFLRFDDWIAAKTHLRKDWITVGRFDDFSHNSFGTFSVLAPNESETIKKILAGWSWEQSSDFGKPYFSMHYPSKKISFHLGDKEERNGISFEAFTILREFYSAAPSRVDVIQSFMFYHGLCCDSQNDRCIEPISEEEVIKYVNPCFVNIKTHYIRDYLAARNMILVRYHDHRRLVNRSFSEIVEKEKEEIEVIEEDRRFYIVISQGLDRTAETFSRLLGKDIVYPYKEPTHRDFLYLVGKEEKKYEHYIIDIGEQGKKIEETCNERNLSPGKFLIPTFFKREVLRKYFQNPRRYIVTGGYLSCLNLWGLPFGINNEGLVHVWLGDLGRIPYEEQLHFRQYNVVPSGGLSEEFYRTQILAQFVESKDLVYNLQKLRDEINNLCESKLGFRIFKELSEEDLYIYKSLHVPTTTEFQELDEQLIFLAKLLPDSIDKSKLETIVFWKPATNNENTKLRYLEKFLEKIFCQKSTESEQIVQPFRNLQRLRSLSAAHTKSEEFEKTLIKMGLNRKDPQEIFIFLISSIVVEMKKIKAFLEDL